MGDFPSGHIQHLSQRINAVRHLATGADRTVTKQLRLKCCRRIDFCKDINNNQFVNIHDDILFDRLIEISFPRNHSNEK